MPFTTNLTGTTEVDSSTVLAYEQGVLVASGQAQILEPFVQIKADIGAKSIGFTRYGRLALATTPLSETDDVVSAALSDSDVILTPKEYGNAVTTTKLASLQTGGRVDIAKATLVGINMGATQDALIIAALNASTNSTAGGVTGVKLDAAYSRLAAKSVASFENGTYAFITSEADIAVLRNEPGFTEVAKYASAEGVLRNEVGFYKGFRILRHQGVAAGSGFGIGFNSLGKAVSQEPGLVITAGGDKLNRFVNMGWYGVFEYKIVDADAVEKLVA